MDRDSGSLIKDFLSFTLIALLIVIPIRIYIAQPFIVSGASMFPTFETGDYLVVDQISYNFDKPTRGDVIIFKYPNDTSKFFIKRIIGLPGEIIEIEGTKVYIVGDDGKRHELSEPYITLQREEFIEKKLASDEYFVMGDNRLASLDSRNWGPLKENFIIGKAFLRLLPFDELNYLPGKYQNYEL